MELEIKHIAPYFPFEINVLKSGTKYNVLALYPHKIKICYKKSGSGFIVQSSSELDGVQLILRSFESITENEAIMCGLYLPKKNWHELSWSQVKERISQTIKNNTQIEFTVNEIESLLKLHFDLYGLIEKGLAVDINTLSANGS